MKNKRLNVLPVILIAAVLLSRSAQAAVLETWDFTGSNGADVSTAPSVPGGVSVNNSDILQIQNNAVQIQRNTAAGSFANIDLSSTAIGTGVTSGVYQIQWTVVSADFTNSETAGTTGQFGWG